MYKKLTPLLLLLFSWKALAVEYPVEIAEYIDDIKIVAYINENDINGTSPWSPFGKPPPLSVDQALQAVQNFITTNPDFTDITLTGIELKQIPHHETYWHYLVKVKFKHNGTTQPHFFAVLMDGKVISAIKLPESIK